MHTKQTKDESQSIISQDERIGMEQNQQQTRKGQHIGGILHQCQCQKNLGGIKGKAFGDKLFA